MGRPGLMIIFFLLIFPLSTVYSQSKYTISGFVKDIDSGEELIGANVFIESEFISTTTNVYGFYSLTLPADTYAISFSFIGYQPINKKIILSKSTSLNIEIQKDYKKLPELVVKEKQDAVNVKRVTMGVEKLSMESIKKIPQLAGEADVIKSIMLRPGITSVGEGGIGFNVRGGHVDQNLILLDESPVYNASHLFGIFSAFNPDAIKDAHLYKGGIHAKYGGRLSSVLDIRQRDGNMKKFHAQGGLGLIFSRLTVEGPIKKDKASFLISARRSYIDLFLKIFDDLGGSKAHFYDINGKANWKINQKNRIYFSGYFGRDVFRALNIFEIGWGNKTYNLRWNHIFGNKSFMNTTYVYSEYDYSLILPTGPQAYTWDSKISTHNAKIDFSHYLNVNNTIETGLDFLFYDFFPGEAGGHGKSSFVSSIKIPAEKAVQFSFYVNNEQKISERLSLNYGIRYSHFFNIGEKTENIYKYGIPTTNGHIVGTENYGQNKVIKSYGDWEPRLNINYQLSERSSVKASYQRTKQYIHLLTNTTTATPVDVYKPAGKYVKPSTANQASVGYFRNFISNKYEFSTEIYYKTIQDVLEYRSGVSLILNDNVETGLLPAKGRAYGIEFLLAKKEGKLNGWIAYTIGKSELQTKGFVAGNYIKSQNGINNGNWYPSNWDRLHNLSIVSNYKINERYSVSANFILTSGRPVTMPSGTFPFEGKSIPIYTSRNSQRAPTSHRLDLSVTIASKKNKKRKWKSEWVFGLYNVYGQRNPYTIYAEPDSDKNTQIVAKRLSIIGIPFPSVTYNFKF